MNKDKIGCLICGITLAAGAICSHGAHMLFRGSAHETLAREFRAPRVEAREHDDRHEERGGFVSFGQRTIAVATSSGMAVTNVFGPGTRYVDSMPPVLYISMGSIRSTST